jgi:hypothetical protein
MAAAIVIPTIAGYTFETAANLADPSERVRLSPPGLKAFFRIMEKWDVRDPQARDLLGGISSGSFYELKRNYRKRPLSQDALTRVSFVIGIYKALNILYNPKFANAWISLPNTNPMFGGAAPLDYMLRNGQPGMMNVRRLLDARRGGQ